MLAEVISWGVVPASVTGDSWYSSTKNFKAIKNKGLGFMFALKGNRQVSLEKNKFMSVKYVDIPEEGLTVWLREFGFVRLYRTTLKNEYRHYALYFPEGASLDHVSRSEFEAIHDTHWQIEQYHRAIKQVYHIERSQVRAEAGVRNHVFAALSGLYSSTKNVVIDIDYEHLCTSSGFIQWRHQCIYWKNSRCN